MTTTAYAIWVPFHNRKVFHAAAIPPVGITFLDAVTVYPLTEDLILWLDAIFTVDGWRHRRGEFGDSRSYTGMLFEFRNSKDLMLFKLTWV